MQYWVFSHIGPRFIDQLIPGRFMIFPLSQSLSICKFGPGCVNWAEGPAALGIQKVLDALFCRKKIGPQSPDLSLKKVCPHWWQWWVLGELWGLVPMVGGSTAAVALCGHTGPSPHYCPQPNSYTNTNIDTKTNTNPTPRIPLFVRPFVRW